MNLFKKTPQPPTEAKLTSELVFPPYTFWNKDDPALAMSSLGEIFKIQIVERQTSIIDKKSVLTTSEVKLLPHEMISSHICPLCQSSFKLPPPVKWSKERQKEYVIALVKNKRRIPICQTCIWQHAPELSMTWSFMNAGQQWVRKAVERFGCTKVR